MKQVKVKKEGYYSVGTKTVYVKKGQTLKVNGGVHLYKR